MRNLNTPITNLDTDKQYVSGGEYKLILDNAGNIDMNKSYYQYLITNLPSKDRTPHKIAASSLPAAFRNKLKEIHSMVVNHAESQGLLLPGTDTDDL